MDPELRDTFARFERYFELIQTRFDGVDGRFDAIEARFDTLESKVDAQQLQIATLENAVARLEYAVSAQQDDNVSIRAELKSLRIEMQERFISIDEQLRTLTLRVQQFEANTDRNLAAVNDHVTHLGERMKSVETGVVGVHGRMDTLGDDMRQRFREVNDRLRGIEQRTAA